MEWATSFKVTFASFASSFFAANTPSGSAVTARTTAVASEIHFFIFHADTPLPTSSVRVCIIN